MRFNSIRHTLVFVISLFITALLVGITAATYLYFKQSARELIFSQQFAMVSSVARDLDKELKRAQTALISIADITPPAVVNDSLAAEAWLRTHVTARTIFSASLFILDNTGVMRGAVPARPHDYGKSFADRDYFTTTMSSGAAQISAPILSREINKPVIILTAPIRKGDGSIAGVLCGRINLLDKDSLLAQLTDVKLGSNGYLYLFATDRTMIMHRDPTRIMKRDVKPGANKLFDRALDGFEGSGETVNSKGLSFIVSFKRLRSTNWILAANYPVAEAYQPITRFRNYILLTIVAALLATIALAWKLGLGVTRPLSLYIEQITDLAQSGSNKQQRLDESRSDELGLLAVSFNMLMSDMQRREQELREERLLLAGVIDATKVGTWEWNIQTKRIAFNTFAADIIGYPLEEVSPDTIGSWMRRVHPDDLVVCKDLMSKHFSGELPDYHIEMRMMHKDGRWVWIINRGKVTRWAEDGTPLLMQGTHQDISERKRAEESKRKLIRAVEQCPVTILITDTDGTIEFVNPKFTELTGYSAEEAIGQNPRVLKSDQTPPEVFTDLWATITKGKTWEGDFVNKSKDGTLFQEHAVISALLDETGVITHYLAVKEDITEKKKIQKELISAKDKAEAATLAKSQFLATMSHEIRTPMNGVIGMTGLLLETELDEEQRGYAEIVNRSGENLLSLINDILDFSKIEAGRLDMETLDFDLRTTLEDTVELLTFRSREAGLELICHIDPSVPTHLRGDPGRVRQVITNLAGNAIKFTHEGEVAIGAELMSSQDDNFCVIRFTVRDTGIGIPESRRAAVFEPFTQADGSTTRKYGGTGLGLAICKQLTELMGGEIGIESEVGKGSTFWFTARFEKQTHIEIQSNAPLLHADIKGTRILVVDDNSTNRTLLAALLSHWECSYELTADGMSALCRLREAAAEKNPFQIALLDQEMPGMDGSELGRQIKADPQLQSTLLIMVTSLAQRGDAAVLEKIGFTGYLPKPVRQSQLYSCIALALSRARTPEVPAHLITRHTVAEVASRALRILLAEDNIINQKVAQSILGKLGYKADVAANGLEAVRALEIIDYDIVLMDCMMPEMDGFAATAVIRDPSSPVRNHAVPVIAMTANAMQGDREQCLASGMDDYLAKPVKKDELAAILEKWGGK